MDKMNFRSMMPKVGDADIFISGYETMIKRIASVGVLTAHSEHLLKYKPGRKISAFAEYLLANGECAALLDSGAAQINRHN